MRTGKLSEAALMRSVLRQLHTDLSVSRAQYGADCAALKQADASLTVCTAVSAPPGFAHRPGVIVTAAVNNLVAGGAGPEALVIHAAIPPSCGEAALRADMKQIAQAAEHFDMQVLCGDTEVSEAVKRPLYHVTGIGRKKVTNDLTLCWVQPLLQPGQTLVATKWIALAGTAALAYEYEEVSANQFPFALIDHAKGFEKLMSVAKEARVVAHFGMCAMHDLSQGGIFGALWEMAERAGVGLEVDLKKIPVKQETIELCEYFDINPYLLYSAGSLLIGTDQPETLIRELSVSGVSATAIGRVTDGNDRIIRNGEDMRFLDRPQQDEWYRKFGGKNERTDFNIS